MTVPWVRLRPWLRLLVLGAAPVVSVQEYVLARIGNFVTFSTAAARLPRGENLYGPINGKLDYLYSPTFALLFAPFRWPPTLLGLVLWNLVNAALLLAAVERLLPDPKASGIALLLIVPELVTSLQNTQSNAAVAGLVVLAFLAYEARRPFAAGLAVATGAAIKIFPAGAALFLVPHARRTRAVLALALASLILLLAPLVATSPAALAAQYRWWAARTGTDLSLAGTSVIAILRSWFGYAGPGWLVQGAGAMALLAPLALRRSRWSDPAFRRLFLCSLLVFMVIFNHNAESPSFVIAMTGIAAWYATTRRTALHHALIVLCLLVLWIATETIVPDYVRHEVVGRYALKAVACLLCWIAMQRDLLGRPSAPARAVPAGDRAAT